MKNLQQLKSVIQTANPRIMDFETGCQTSRGTFMGKQFEEEEWYFVKDDDVNGDHDIFFSEDVDDLKILGRPIRLADILLAISKTGLVSSLLSCMVHKDGTFTCLDFSWNLKDDSLDQQSPETLAFLINLLCK